MSRAGTDVSRTGFPGLSCHGAKGRFVSLILTPPPPPRQRVVNDWQRVTSLAGVEVGGKLSCASQLPSLEGGVAFAPGGQVVRGVKSLRDGELLPLMVSRCSVLPGGSNRVCVCCLTLCCSCGPSLRTHLGSDPPLPRGAISPLAKAQDTALGFDAPVVVWMSREISFYHYKLPFGPGLLVGHLHFCH